MIFKLIPIRFAVFFCCLMNVFNVTGQEYQAPAQPQEVKPLFIGETIADKKLPDANGALVDLGQAFKNRPTILVFYRGGWCPYCQVQLAGLQKAFASLDSIGYQVFAVSTDSPKNMSETIKKRKLSYTLLSDADLALAEHLGIAFVAPKNYHSFLTEASGGKNTRNLLPVPAVYILNKKGEIKFQHIDPDFKVRMGPELILSVAKAYWPEVQ
ncbi:peroxiredoxin-like family protein [Niabella insulamsoli]|uniref:peroxiredoxin-like family protein n=1 Tax=Niabella insulamsoli TaxID=3144874 RepID=UPI0031FBC4A2